MKFLYKGLFDYGLLDLSCLVDKEFDVFVLCTIIAKLFYFVPTP